MKSGFQTKVAIVAAMTRMQEVGLSPGRSGNVSVRHKEGMLITASGLRPEDLNAETDIVSVKASGASPAGSKKPSSEWRLHLAIYAKRREIGSVVHCHSRFATALACLREPIPAFHYMVAKAGGAAIPLATYATYGSAELAAHAAAALKERNACLLANHGQVALGETLEEALELAEEVEVLAAQFVAARSIGRPILLPDEEMIRVAAKLRTYGKAAQAGTVPRTKRKPQSRS